MNLYLLRWKTPEPGRRTAFDGVVVVAPDPDTARAINPRGDLYSPGAEGWHLARRWADSPDEVEAVLLGTAVEGDRSRVVLASFHEVQGSY